MSQVITGCSKHSTALIGIERSVVQAATTLADSNPCMRSVIDGSGKHLVFSGAVVQALSTRMCPSRLMNTLLVLAYDNCSRFAADLSPQSHKQQGPAFFQDYITEKPIATPSQYTVAAGYT